MSYVHHESYDATVELCMKIKEIVYLGIYSVYLEIYFWPRYISVYTEYNFWSCNSVHVRISQYKIFR